MQPLSQQLSDLSVRAKNIEDSVAAAQKEAHDKVMARREQAQAAAAAAIQKVDRDIKSVGESAAKNWAALQAKIASDLNVLKAGMAVRKQDRDVKRSEHQAERLEQEAAFAIDYAIASVEQAKVAIFDAIAGRIEADDTKGRRAAM